jgi:hypothetical protein
MVCAVALAAGGAVAAQMTPWLQWTLLPRSQVAEIVGEASGENAWKMIMETGGYDKGALGVISIQGTRTLFDPMQIGWASVRGTPDKPAKFAFQIPPREGEFLKRRLLAGERITVSAKVETAMRPYTI